MPEQPPGIGDQLRRYRARAGFSQEVLAERAQLTRSGLAALERGRRQRPYPDTLRRLAEALALSPAERSALLALARAPRVHTGAPAAAQPAAAAPANMPPPRTRLIGREREVAALRALLPAHPGRLVTLTGIGGGGKTRLALAVAGELRTTFPDGVWLVELAPLADPSLVPLAVAAALAVPEIDGMPVLDRLIATLRERTVLLLLDNCEHLVDACAALAERLLSACPAVRILATSREPLQLNGERQWRVPALGLPAEDRSGSLAALEDSAAVQLFVERAQAIDGEFRLNAANAAAVAEVCVRLDGIPLAIELAAARVRVLSPAQILARLDDSVQLLTGGNRAAPTRQQTLRAALDWSYEFLPAAEQATFRRLAAFAGSFDLAAVEAVCAADDLPVADVLGLLTLLVDKSLLLVEQGAAMARYRLLEPVRQYALAQLRARGEQDQTQARHATYYLALAEQAEPELIGPRQVAWLMRLEGEHHNLRAALRASLESGETADALRLVSALGPFWEKHGHLSEGRRSCQAALAAAGENDGSVRAWALLRAAVLAHYQGDLDAAATLCTESLMLARSVGESGCAACAVGVLGSGYAARGDFARAKPLLEESLRESQSLSDPWGRLAHRHAQLLLGISVLGEGDITEACQLLEQSLAGFQALGDLRFIAVTNTWLGHAVLRGGDPVRAAALLAEALEGHQAVGDRVYFLVYALLHFAEVLGALEQPELAVRLLGAGEALRESLGAPLPLPRAVRHTALVTALRAQLPASTFDAVWAAGRTLTLAETMTEAIDAARQVSRMPAQATADDRASAAEPLTPREREVAKLVARGCSDREIAATLAISVRTASNHVQHLLAKRGLRSRWQLADGQRGQETAGQRG